eukprot:1157343-Pelagomonas_calceolata.AAC.7
MHGAPVRLQVSMPQQFVQSMSPVAHQLLQSDRVRVALPYVACAVTLLAVINMARGMAAGA